MKFKIGDRVKLRTYADKHLQVREFIIKFINRDIAGTPRYVGEGALWGKGYYEDQLEEVTDEQLNDE